MIVLVASRVRVAGPIEELLATHRRVTVPRREDIGASNELATMQVIEAQHTGEQSTLLVRSDEPIDHPAWTVEPVSLEDLVLAYMGGQVQS